jgi:hypothetical protein
MKNLLLFSLFATSILFYSCRKDEDIITNASASIILSTDTLTFDTVFTTIGSITKNIRVYNPHKEAIKISSIRLNGGDNSNFRINVDGSAGSFHQGIEIAAKDSMFIFVEVTVDPNNTSTPFVIEDQIEFITNGNRTNLNLVAWGQNAHYYTPTTFNRNIPDFCCLDSLGNRGPCSDDITQVNVTWKNDLPYVVYGFVVIDSLDVLNIDPGVQIYFHANSGMWVYRNGSLRVNGTVNEPVVFQGDNLNQAYANEPGQWDRIWINDGGFNTINYAVIKNSFIGIQAEVLPFENPTDTSQSFLGIKNTIINNCSGFGLLGSIFNIEAENVAITNCGEYNVAIQAAGDYSFKHCTFANYFKKAARETPLFFVQNSYVNAIGTQIEGTPNVEVSNSIIYGDKDNEYDTEVINNGSLSLDISNCIIKTTADISNNNFYKEIILNPTDIIFNNADQGDFTLFDNSIAKDTANIQVSNTVPFDINGISRLSDSRPDLGAFEYIP